MQEKRIEDKLSENNSRSAGVTTKSQLPSRMVPWKQPVAKRFRILAQTPAPLYCHHYCPMQAAEKVFCVVPSQNGDKWPPSREAISRTQSFPLALGSAKGNTTISSLYLAWRNSELKSHRHIPC